MAGRKQHYLPQHLLRGFEASRAGKKTQVTVYKKGAPPYTTSTEGVAAQRDFYSLPGDGVTDTLDDVITAFERNTFNPFLDLARITSPNEQMDAESASNAVVHLTVRAAHLRGSFAKLAQKMFAKFGDILNDPALAREFVDIDSTSPQSILSGELQKAFDASPILNLPLNERLIIEKMMRFRIREQFDTQLAEFTPLIREQLSMLESTFSNILAQSHNQALQKSLTPAERIKALKGLTWKVFAVEPPSHFVLPDCAAIALTASGELQPLVMSSNEKLSWVAMPISAKQVLVGYTGQELPILSDLNEHFAKCSLEFLVSSRLHSDVGALTALMGIALENLASDLMKESFPTTRTKLGKAYSKVNASHIRIVPAGIKLDAHKKKAINQSIHKIFAQQCGAREADRLESIVIASDVVREVASLYGRALSPYEVAVTMHGTVESIPGTAPITLRIILPELIGQLLLATDFRLKRSATLQIMHLLGRVSYLDHWFSDITPTAEGRILTTRQRISLELTSRFASHYHGSIKATPTAHESDLNNYECLTTHAVTIALTTLEAARQKFILHKDADALIADIFPALDILLGALAGYFGQRAHGGTNCRLSQASPTCEHLVRVGLWDWANLFRNDLHRHYQSLVNASFSFDQVLALAEHVERLLWNFGLFLSDVEDGRVWVDAYDDERLRMVKQILHS